MSLTVSVETCPTREMISFRNGILPGAWATGRPGFRRPSAGRYGFVMLWTGNSLMSGGEGIA
jgi:hypothetical protein